MTTTIAFIVVLGLLIFFHELGHFLVARACGVGVEKFSLGFGPRMFGKTVGRTDYRISAIPLGGYVKMVGEEPDAELPPDDIPFSFTHKSVWQRILIVGAGPTFNLLLAVLIFWLIFMTAGKLVLQPTVGKVEKGTPAHQAGLQKGDRITAINGQAVQDWEAMAEMVGGSKGRSLTFTIRRGEHTLSREIRPEKKVTQNLFGENIERYLIGINAGRDVIHKRLNPIAALGESLYQSYEMTRLTVLSIVKLIEGTVSTETLGGPIMIAQLTGEQAEQGMMNLAAFVALLSINLGILNFLPIPVLDGGHLLFFFIEAAIGHPVNLKTREIAQQAGLFLLILLMIFVFYNDIARLFSSS